MRLKDIILANKTVTDWGTWQGGGSMPRTAFQLSKAKNRIYRQGSYRWRIVRFEALNCSFRLLVTYHSGKEQYRAALAIEYDRDMAVLAHYEFHGTHPGWHMHVFCDKVEQAPTGLMRHPYQQRMPLPRGYHRREEFGILNDDRALQVVADIFKLHKAADKLI